MADYEINAEIKADSKGFTNGIEKAQKSTKSFSSSITKTLKSVTGLSLGLAGATKVVKDTIKYINQSTEAYKAEALSLKALETAVNNNPFTNGESIQGLKDFASEIQRTTNYGDDYLFPFMQQLISSGRTQAETMKIIKVATDIASSGAMSFETAIQQLNATMNGNIGRLGQQNAELKSLTEEELRSGKAVEILGEKYKGLAEATVDSRKQLENAKGDLKEAIGQLTSPSADLWNNFWKSFYELGITTINKFDDWLGAKNVGKKIVAPIEEGFYDFYDNGDLKNAFSYLRDTIKSVTDEELRSINIYFEGLKSLSDVEKRIWQQAKDELYTRELVEKQRQAEIEKANELKKIEAERLAQEERDAEKVANAKEELLEQEKRNKEKIHEVEVENARALAELRRKELEEEEKIAKAREEFENASGLDNKIEALKKLIKEEEDAGNETDELRKKLIQLKTISGVTKALSSITNAVAGIVKGFKQAYSTIKNVVSGTISILQNLANFNYDSFLDNLLSLEDGILSFFVSAKTMLPKLVENVVGSISILLQNINNLLTVEDVASTVTSILTTISDNLPTIVSNIVGIVSTLLEGFTKGLSDWVSSGGWRNLLNAFLELQKGLEKAITDNLPEIVDTIIEMLPDLIDTLVASIVSASQTLGKIAPTLIKAVMAIIGAILEVITSDEVIDASIEAIEGIVEALVSELLPKLPKFILKIINFLFIKLPSYIPKLVVGIVKGLVKGFAQTDWKQVVIDIFEAFVDGIKDFFGIHSPSTLFQELGGFMVDGLKIGLEGIADILDKVLSGISDVVNGILDGIGKLTSISFDGIINSTNSVFDGLSNITNLSFDGIINSTNSFFDGLSKITNLSFDGLTKLTNTSFSGINSSVSTLADAFVKVNDSISKSLTTLKDFVKELTSFGNSESGDYSFGDFVKDWIVPFGFLFAKGTNNAPSGLALVGEQGPELIDMHGGERVYTAQNTKAILGNASGNAGNTMNVTFNNLKDTTASAMMSQLRYYNRQLAVNGF